MVDYIVVEHRERQPFHEMVEKYTKMGYQLIGGVTFTGKVFRQSMYR